MWIIKSFEDWEKNCPPTQHTHWNYFKLHLLGSLERKTVMIITCRGHSAHWADLGVQVAWIHYLASIHVNLYPLAAQSAVLGYWEAGRWFGRDAVIPMIILPTPNYYCFITFGKRMSNLQSRYNRDCEYLICCHISSRPPPLSSLTSLSCLAGWAGVQLTFWCS